MHQLKPSRKIVLASASPRRQAILKQIGLKFSIDASHYEEKINLRLKPRELAEKLSLEKAKIVASRYKNAIIISADTLVLASGKLLGKPQTEENSQKILHTLSGKIHSVITGFTVIDTCSGKTITKSAETKVYMKKMTEEEIDNYVKTKEPLDKAGGYGIQELGGILVEKIEGDYFNVVGLPLASLVAELKKFGVKIL